MALSPRVEGMEGRVLLSSIRGDFNGDGFTDLAVGVPAGEVSTIREGALTWIRDAGEVEVRYCSRRGLGDSSDGQVWHQNSPGIYGDPEEDDHFGGSLATGDFNGDGYSDLAIGIPDKDIWDFNRRLDLPDAGAVQVLYGSQDGLTAAGNQLWHQGSPGLLGDLEAYDRFGWSLVAGDFNGDAIDDLAVGVPFESFGRGSLLETGAVHAIYGSLSGLNTYRESRNQLWWLPLLRAENHLGWSLMTGDFNGDGVEDLAAGMPGFDDYEWGGGPPPNPTSATSAPSGCSSARRRSPWSFPCSRPDTGW